MTQSELKAILDAHKKNGCLVIRREYRPTCEGPT